MLFQKKKFKPYDYKDELPDTKCICEHCDSKAVNYISKVLYGMKILVPLCEFHASCYFENKILNGDSNEN